MTYAAEFEDYGAARWGERNLSHAVIKKDGAKKDGAVIGLAQSVLVGRPLFGNVLAYVLFEPVCLRRGTGCDSADWHATIAALREEYTVRPRRISSTCPARRASSAPR